MIVDEQRFRFPQNGWPITVGDAGSGRPFPQSEQNRSPEAEDEPPIVFVPPPVTLTRVFPGL
jgi:hypothetical protein